jgi:hypothetical protein
MFVPLNIVTIDSIASRLIRYTTQASGVAILAHTNAGTADLFTEGHCYAAALTATNLQAGGLWQLKSRQATNYQQFDLLSPISLELFLEMAELYSRLIQARLSPAEMLAMLDSQDY